MTRLLDHLITTSAAAAAAATTAATATDRSITSAWRHVHSVAPGAGGGETASPAVLANHGALEEMGALGLKSIYECEPISFAYSHRHHHHDHKSPPITAYATRAPFAGKMGPNASLGCRRRIVSFG
ncbi:unnamed protein product [Protopolystoma xenopodis]|uniref:Secreted protein n=1 Tax=Protopolystoma xenopodis TaxID=117903 RepID=A0A448XJK4_9PLAT|nr:unnamed protein product [Protopolystoma xenopodis]